MTLRACLIEMVCKFLPCSKVLSNGYIMPSSLKEHLRTVHLQNAKVKWAWFETRGTLPNHRFTSQNKLALEASFRVALKNRQRKKERKEERKKERKKKERKERKKERKRKKKELKPQKPWWNHVTWKWKNLCLKDAKLKIAQIPIIKRYHSWSNQGHVKRYPQTSSGADEEKSDKNKFAFGWINWCLRLHSASLFALYGHQNEMK
jgi:hypothetical protein